MTMFRFIYIIQKKFKTKDINTAGNNGFAQWLLTVTPET